MTSTFQSPQTRIRRAARHAIARRRILQVITPSHMSGAEMQLVRLTRMMRSRGHEMRVLVKDRSHVAPEMRRLGVEVETARISGKLNLLAASRIAHAARRHGAELVQSTLSTASWWCGWMEAMGGPRSIGHVQGFTSAKWHRRQSHLLAASGAVRDHLVKQGISPARITVLYNALESEDFRPERSPRSVRAEFGAGQHEPVVGAFGHLSPKKGYRELFAAIPRILRQFPSTQFWIVGQGALRRELERTAEAGGFAANVRFAGFRRDVADLMNAIDILALPSRREPCALVYIEAALLGKPIVACRAGGAPESVADEETGLLVPTGDASAVADAVMTLLDNWGLALRMGEAGRARARELFSWSRFAATLEGVYDRVLSAPR